MPGVGEPIRVLKLNLAGEVTWQYEGYVMHHDAHSVVLVAFFNRPDLPFADVVFKQNDRFVETFYLDRWYNIFEIHDRDTDALKGWYCNIGKPARIGDGTVSYVDLALDLWVSADGRQTVIDQDEFEALQLGAEDRSAAMTALVELQQAFKEKRPPS